MLKPFLNKKNLKLYLLNDYILSMLSPWTIGLLEQDHSYCRVQYVYPAYGYQKPCMTKTLYAILKEESLADSKFKQINFSSRERKKIVQNIS